jgi:hypothetical protein
MIEIMNDDFPRQLAKTVKPNSKVEGMFNMTVNLQIKKFSVYNIILDIVIFQRQTCPLTYSSKAILKPMGFTLFLRAVSYVSLVMAKKPDMGSDMGVKGRAT